MVANRRAVLSCPRDVEDSWGCHFSTMKEQSKYENNAMLRTKLKMKQQLLKSVNLWTKGFA